MMDTSETYVKMCEKAVEIQGEWKPTPGDFIYRKFNLFGEKIDREIWSEDELSEINIIWWKSVVDGFYACTNEKGESRTYKHPADMVRETSVWLPRQDQLQEMVHFTNPHEMLDRFDMFRGDFEGEFTMEQLWLAFVMKEKYGKTWNGEDWVTQASLWRIR
jgi:hypothetical protein